MTREDIFSQLDDVTPDHLVMNQVERGIPEISTADALAQYMTVAVQTLYSQASQDDANLERIAFDLEHASMNLASAAKRLRQLQRRP